MTLKSTTPESFEITRPDDWHLHLRDGTALRQTVAATAAVFKRAIIMPNLVPPITTTDQADAYKQRISECIPEGSDFDPLMTLYLTDNTKAEEIVRAKESGLVHACKLYPAGATTNSDSGVTDVKHLEETLEAMSANQLPLLIHGEVVQDDVDIFDREKRFIDEILHPLTERFKQLPTVLEHITTKDAADFVLQAPSNVAATITAHHLLHNRNDMLVGGIRPHFYCLPILKRQSHQLALQDAAISGNSKFFLGTDSAPHTKDKKETACGCAGCYTAPVAMELYAEAFSELGALDKLEGFASFFGADFYGLPRNEGKIRLTRQNRAIPATLPLGDSEIVPFRAESETSWTATVIKP